MAIARIDTFHVALQAMMVQPVIAADGHTYKKHAIQDSSWLSPIPTPR